MSSNTVENKFVLDQGYKLSSGKQNINISVSVAWPGLTQVLLKVSTNRKRGQVCTSFKTKTVEINCWEVLRCQGDG